MTTATHNHNDRSSSNNNNNNNNNYNDDNDNVNNIKNNNNISSFNGELREKFEAYLARQGLVLKKQYPEVNTFDLIRFIISFIILSFD